MFLAMGFICGICSWISRFELPGNATTPTSQAIASMDENGAVRRFEEVAGFLDDSQCLTSVASLQGFVCRVSLCGLLTWEL
jgi:hypothetical protein